MPRIAAVCLLVLAACRPEAPPPAFANLGPDAHYVGAAACASCHADVAAAYASHPMAESMVRLTAGRRVEPLLDRPVVDPHTGFEYRVVEVDGRLAQEERQVDGEGREVARLVRPMAWVVGSGNTARTYFAERGDGLVQLPLTWYAADGGRWALSPGYETANPRFDRTMPDRCMACHNAPPETVPGVEGAFASIPEGIGCESCHGPGSLHVVARTAGAAPGGGADLTIVNPAWLPPDLRVDVCQSCHLHGTVDVFRDGETAFSFRPGRPLHAHVGLFTVPELVDEGEGITVASHADRMRASACYLETQGTDRALECTSCHDPHQSFASRGPGAATAACLSCHAPDRLQAAVPARLRPEHGPGADCVSCHMPRVGASDVPHSAVTDHWVRVVGGEARPVAVPPLGRTGAVIPLDDRDRVGVEGGLYEGMAAVAYGTRAARADAVGVGAQFIEIALGRLPDAARRGDAQFLLGVAHLSVGRPREAVGPLQRAADAGGPDLPQRLETLARAFADAGRAADAESAFRLAVRAQPRRPASRREFGRFLLAQDRPADAERELRAALDLDPWDAEAHLLLGLAAVATGRDGRQAWEAAVRLSPPLVDAIASGLVVGPDARRPLWTGATVFGWPARSGWAALSGTRPQVFTQTGTPLLRVDDPDTWGGRDARGRPLPTGVYLAAGPGGRLVRFAVVRVAGAVPPA